MEENKNIPRKQPSENIPAAGPPQDSQSGGEMEQSEIPPSNEANSPSEEIILPKAAANTTNEQLSTINSQFSTEKEMEVHHHTHPDSHRAHGKKNWKSYFWEFLMLFLAITLGFFVENQREHYIENQRAKGLVTSFITDLKKDTSLLNWLNDFRNHKRRVRLDSFYLLLKTPAEKMDKSIYYPLMHKIAEHYSFSQSTGTIDQLKNAGYLRYFSDTRLLNYISEYEFWVGDLKRDQNLEFNLHYDKLMQLVKQNSDNDDMHKFYVGGEVPGGTAIIPFKPDVLIQIKAHIIELMWYNHPQMIMQNERVKSKAVEIITYLQTKYHVK